MKKIDRVNFRTIAGYTALPSALLLLSAPQLAAQSAYDQMQDDINTAMIAAETRRATAAEAAIQAGVDQNAADILKLNAQLTHTIAEGETAPTPLKAGEYGIAGIATKKKDGLIHIGTNSFLFDETAGAHRLTTNDGTLILGGGAVVEVEVDLGVAGDVYINGNAGVQAQLDAHAADISTNTSNIVNNETIEANSVGVATNYAYISTNRADISTNASNIATNDAAIRADFAAADIADQAYTDAREAAITSAYQAAAADLQAQIDLLAAHIASLAAVDDTASAIPSEINYQGRLTDTNGNPAAGSKEFTLKLYDAASGGNELYAESIGSVLIDSNGIYSFQFGAHGSSHATHTETAATANGTDLVYTAALNDTPLEATLSVTDGTYSWNIVDGNTATPAVADAEIVNGFVVGVPLTDFGAGYSSAPTVSISGDGTGATATAFVSDGAITSINMTSPGSGYSSATVAIDPPTAPFIVNYSNQALEIIYASAPDAGTEISSSYAYLEDGINQALAAGSAHWLELTIDGAVQSPRERILSVPFALTSAQAQKNTKLIQLLEDSIEQLQED
jgi:hypothetical protein